MRIISDEEARGVLSMASAIETLEDALKEYSSKSTTVLPRAMIRAPNGIYRVMSASLPKRNIVGSKEGFRVSEQQGNKTAAYASEIITLYDLQTGELLAIVKSHSIDEFRTAASAAIGSKFLSRSDSRVACLFGSGLHAGPQLRGLQEVRKLELVKVFSRNQTNRERFCKEMSKEVDYRVIPVSGPDEAVEDVDIIVESTTSATPVFDGKKIKEGVHITSIGGGFSGQRQLDDETFERADLFAVGSKQEALYEGSSDILGPVMKGVWRWNEITEIADIVSQKALARQTSSDITVYKSLGMGLYDVALASYILDKLGG